MMIRLFEYSVARILFSLNISDLTNQCLSIIISQLMKSHSEISKLYAILSNVSPQCPKSTRLKQFQTQLAHKPNLASAIISQFAHIFNTYERSLPEQREAIFVGERLACIPKYQPFFETLQEQHIRNLCKYIQKEKECSYLENVFNLIGNLSMNKQMKVVYRSQMLFKSLLEKFIQISEEEAQWLLTQVMIQLMLSHHQFVKIANNPYYFLQFWLHYINQQPKLDKKLYHIRAIKTFYELPYANDGLFYQSDFKTLIDIMLRIMSECPDGHSIAIPLQCYITLTKSGMLSAPYKLQDYIDFISCLNTQQLHIKNLADQVLNMQ